MDYSIKEFANLRIDDIPMIGMFTFIVECLGGVSQ